MAMTNRAILLLSAGAGLFLPIAAGGADVVFESKPTRTHLLELFTSEGCSSCPPAEAWLSKLKDDPRLWQDFVPIAFHVDYWDRLGWRDPFAVKAWTARQYQYSTAWGSSSVYTPGFVLDGREWRNTRVPGAAPDAPGILRISLTSADSARAAFRPAQTDARSFDVHVARLGFGLNIKVKAGENSGRDLRHDFVVLSLADERLGPEGKELHLPVIASAALAANERTAIAAWITESGRVGPVQAVGGWVP